MKLKGKLATIVYPLKEINYVVAFFKPCINLEQSFEVAVNSSVVVLSKTPIVILHERSSLLYVQAIIGSLIGWINLAYLDFSEHEN